MLSLEALLRYGRWNYRKGYRRHWRSLLRGSFNRGWCPICEQTTLFVIAGPWLRDQYFCLLCDSIPRWRALLQVLHEHAPEWRALALHESSPGGPASMKLAAECTGYVASHWWPDRPLGAVVDGVRCENLEAQTFPDATFDLVVTADVFEHVLRPELAFREIARTLKRDGLHVFTVPYYRRAPTRKRATIDTSGQIVHLLPPDYHRNPISPDGSLVVTEWGTGLAEFIWTHSGMCTEMVSRRDRQLGLDGEFLEVFVSRKPVAERDHQGIGMSPVM
jgi:SAM-dependent methyltransferase